MQLTADLSQLQPEVRNALIRKLSFEDKARHDLGVVEQVRMKRMYDQAGRGLFKDHLGPAQLIMSQDQHQRAMQKYGQFIFMDPDFVPWLLKHNPDMRVKQEGTRIQTGWTPAQGKASHA
jgi:hypothetical protein